MKVWMFVILIFVAIGFGVWMEWYGNKCQACKDRKKKIANFLGLNEDEKTKTKYDPTKFGYDPNMTIP